MEGIGWWHKAACANSDPEMFFDASREAEAKACCRGCSVKEPCLRGEVDHYGVFGGFNGHEREKVRSYIS